MSRELIVVTTHNASPAIETASGAFPPRAAVSALQHFLKANKVILEPLFRTAHRDALDSTSLPSIPETSTQPFSLQTLSLSYRLEAPQEQLDSLVQDLQQFDDVEAAYVKPAVELPSLNMMTAHPGPAPASTPHLRGGQGYLEPAPESIDAQYAWSLSGGTGAGVSVIDIEGAWLFTHEDFRRRPSGVVAGISSPALEWRNHGTAVLGVIRADHSATGVSGICPDRLTANGKWNKYVGWGRLNVFNALRRARR
jgi:hypothetical protein